MDTAPDIDSISEMTTELLHDINDWQKGVNLTVLDDKAIHRFHGECAKFKARLKRISADQELKALTPKRKPAAAAAAQT